ncbi:serine hydrolase [Geodermatophilus sp. DSM 44513]|uniref:serine hydrolase domain-containing protein n=1 Tax=Geodermatophilus sp. DSM 44513 TaxID=1528104 RepID=UPI00128154A2|nr:serine hydrolase domain-containing protein [Geodermatophilus sp. DSM 44513]WNV74282.1 serine hydrolase domain-containing protein [Geodermatophilus sp. DSM 44513]
MTTVPPRVLAFDPDRLRRVREALESDIARELYDGAAVAVGRAGDLTALEVVGFADRAAGTPLTEDQLLVPFSISKQFFNTVVLSYVERGLLNLLQPVHEVLPGFEARGKHRVALWHLLTHTSGILSGLAPLPPEDLIYYEKWTEYAAAAAPEAEPGTRVIYSLLAAQAVMGSMLVAVDPEGRGLSRILAEELLEPVGMTSTSFGPPQNGRPVAPVVPRYRRPAGLFQPQEVQGVGALLAMEGAEIPGAGCITTIGDVFRFADMLRAGGIADGHRVLSPAMLELATRNWTGDLPNSLFTYALSSRHWAAWPGSVGLGFFVRGEGLTPGPLPNLGSPRTFGGWGSGTSLFWVDPQRDVAFALLTTGALEDSDHVVRSQRISDMVLAALR